MTLQEFANQFIEYVSQNGGNGSEWYVGITNTPEERVFVEHNVDRSTGAYIYDNTFNEKNARTVEQYLIGKLKTKGGGGGGDETSTWVYAYKITHLTIE